MHLYNSNLILPPHKKITTMFLLPVASSSQSKSLLTCILQKLTRPELKSHIPTKNMSTIISLPITFCLLAPSFRLSTESHFMEWLPSLMAQARQGQPGLLRKKHHYITLPLCGDVTTQSFWNFLPP